MGIYDREYYRGETRGSGLFTTAPVCRAIILVNVAVHVLTVLSEQWGLIPHGFFDDWFAAHSHAIFYNGYIWQLITAPFMHAGVMHLLLNMYFFWVFGHELEAMYGAKDFLALYISAAVVSTFGWAVIDLASQRPGFMVGASGAVLAVTVIYALFFPRRELLFMFVIPVEVWFLVSLLVAIDTFYLLKGVDQTDTAVAAHVVGAAYGFLFRRFDLRWSRMPWVATRRPKLRIVPADPPREKSVPRPSTSSSGPTWSPGSVSASKPVATTAVLPEEQLDARLDEVLAKIAREGRGGLTDDDNRVLQEASRRARNRRSDRL